ncbi:MAG: DMT family transporter [Aquiluna sp.]|nr:DMT family transporter [Aquiluna sp.]
MTIVFGLLSAFSYGYADFVGALAAKKIRAVAVTTYSFSFGLVIAMILSLFVGADYQRETIVLSIYAGICSAIAISCLYAALALGPISIVSPLTAVISAIVPVMFDVFSGQELSSFVAIAVVLILIAVVLVGFVPGEKVQLPSVPAVLYSIAAGLGFSGIFLFLDATASDSGLASLVVMRAIGLLLLLAGLLLLWLKGSKQKQFIERLSNLKLFGLVLLAGFGDVLGNVGFLVATRTGSLTVASVLTALYPVGTILLARIFLKERIALSQSFGIALAIGACALLALG